MEKTIEEVRDWLVENRTDEYGNIDIIGLNFGNKIVWLNDMKAKTIYQSYHKAETIYQGFHEADKIFQSDYQANKIYQNKKKGE